MWTGYRALRLGSQKMRRFISRLVLSGSRANRKLFRAKSPVRGSMMVLTVAGAPTSSNPV
jgi:hypothetical protein